MRREVADPPTDFRTVNAQVFSALGVSRASFDPGPIHTTKGGKGGSTTATASVAAHYTLPAIGSWSETSTVHLVLRRRAWKIAWSPQTIDPQ